nr:caspase family protein [Streptomyces sp. RLB1-33]
MTDVLLVYYVGHGMRTRAEQSTLVLTGTSSDPEVLPDSALLYPRLLEVLRGSPAATKSVILDCCHAELGLDADFHFQSGRRSDGPPAGRRADFAGASSRYEKAKTPLGGRLTYFARTPGDEGTDRALGMICPHAARFAEQRTRAACDRLPRGAARVPEAGPEGGDGVPGSPGVALRRGRRATPGRQRRSPVKRPTLLITSSL